MAKEKEKKEKKAAKRVRVEAEPVIVAEPARKAIMEEHEQRAAMPTRRKPKEMRPSTVKGIIAETQSEIEAIQAKRGEIQKGIAAFYGGVGELYESILDQAKENREAASAMISGVRALQSSINDKIKENADYVKNFYG